MIQSTFSISLQFHRGILSQRCASKNWVRWMLGDYWWYWKQAILWGMPSTSQQKYIISKLKAPDTPYSSTLRVFWTYMVSKTHPWNISKTWIGFFVDSISWRKINLILAFFWSWDWAFFIETSILLSHVQVNSFGDRLLSRETPL